MKVIGLVRQKRRHDREMLKIVWENGHELPGARRDDVLVSVHDPALGLAERAAVMRER
jgi:hypothetical protein